MPTEQALNPFPWYQQMRETKPVFFNTDYYTWNVFGYQDVQRVLSDYESFSSQMMGSGSGQPLENSIINMDPPRHRQLRSLVSQAFTPRRVAQLAPRISEIVQELLDNVSAKGKMDVMDDLASPFPVIVIAELLGVPVEDREHFKRWSAAIVGTENSGPGDSQREMSEYFARLIEQRRREPKDDLISALLQAQVDGESLTPEELYGFCILLLVAGNITTTNLIGNAFLCFDEYPEVLEQLYRDRSLVPGAIEEILRYYSPVRCMYRVSAKQSTLGGQEIGPGQFIVAWIASANRDESEFSHADVFDLRRTPNRHQAFGHGIHFCLGAPLARLETRIALEAMLERLPDMKRVRDLPLEPVNSLILYGVNHFPITFRPA